MKRLNTTFGTILLVLGCFALSPAAKADPAIVVASGASIVGLWDVNYASTITGPAHTFDQWHSDGLEFEVNSVAPGAMCQGTWKEGAHKTIELFHVGFVFNPDGSLQGPFRESQTITVSRDGNSYDGTYELNYYDTNGTLLLHDMGTMHATLLPVGSHL